MSDAAEPLDLDATQRRIDLTLKNVARYVDRTAPEGERLSIVNALADAQTDVATMRAEVDRLRVALTTARRDALNEAADAFDPEHADGWVTPDGFVLIRSVAPCSCRTGGGPMSDTEAEVERLRANLEQVRGSADAWWQMYSDELAAHEQTKAALAAHKEGCLWVRDAENKRRNTAPFYQSLIDPESLRCKPDGHIFCRPCWDKFFLPEVTP